MKKIDLSCLMSLTWNLEDSKFSYFSWHFLHFSKSLLTIHHHRSYSINFTRMCVSSKEFEKLNLLLLSSFMSWLFVALFTQNIKLFLTENFGSFRVFREWKKWKSFCFTCCEESFFLSVDRKKIKTNNEFLLESRNSMWWSSLSEEK